MAASPPKRRDYVSLLDLLPRTGPRRSRMKAVVDVLWEALSPTGVSWVGFYVKGPGEGEMTLTERRDKPACSPLGLHGACGRCVLSGRALVVADVAALGEGYVACDPRDKSEVVVPLLEAGGEAYGVLDLDSYDVASFTEDDAKGLLEVVRATGLSTPPWEVAVEVVQGPPAQK
jgi:putative methionine-R-sulfoxide reductase with GAF domain